jgi:hypothetical protein
MFQVRSHSRPFPITPLPNTTQHNRYGKILIETCASFKGAETEIDERVLCVKSHWKRTSMQLDFIKQIWETLDEEFQNIQTQILQVLVGKLSIATSKLGKLLKKRSDNQATEQRVTEVKRWKYLLIKQCLDEVIQDLASWQRMFDPSWFLILKVSNSLIDQELSRDGSAVSLFPGAHEFRDAVRGQPLHKVSIFLPEDGLNSSTVCEIPFASAKRVQRAGSGKWVVVDSVPCDLEADVDLQTRDVRELARKLSCVEPFAFGILQCRGVVRGVKLGNRRPSSFDFVFQIPKELSNEPKSLRSYLSSSANHSLTDRFKLAKQLAKSVSYVHTLGFVHKNVRPETILVFQDNKSALGSSFLVGFEKVRMADGRTQRSGDSAWEKNLYRHPHRQGLNPEETYAMQHDIYSLGVCLLEIGIWESFVSYEHDAAAPVPAAVLGIALGGAEFSKPALIKEYLVALAKRDLPQGMGERYEDIVVNCLTCLDQDNADFGDQSEFEDIDGVLVGVRYIEKVCWLYNCLGRNCAYKESRYCLSWARY